MILDFEPAIVDFGWLGMCVGTASGSHRIVRGLSLSKSTGRYRPGF
jgi:hypothetical protein